jgi:hypothetical protein
MLTSQYFDRFYDWVVRPVQNQQDIELVDAIDTAHWGNRAFSLEQLILWHQAYPPGNRLLCLEDTVVGGIAIWPIDPKQATAFCAGDLPESQLFPLSKETIAGHAVPHWPATHWYIGGMIIDAPYRKRHSANPIGMLLTMALNSWADSGDLAYPVTIFSTAYSAEGERLLQRFGFELVRDGNQMPDGDPLYRRVAADKNSLFQSFAQHGIPQLFDG